MNELKNIEVLRLSPLDVLRCTCPACFGPGVSPLPNGEPDHIVCLDGNFQHRRHEAASVETGPITHPPTFVEPGELEAMQASLTGVEPRNHTKIPWYEEKVVSLSDGCFFTVL